jgi:hypothetical protein
VSFFERHTDACLLVVLVALFVAEILISNI